jgi:hypothetical protein
MSQRTRNVEIKIRFTPDELDYLTLKMQQSGIRNREAYLRKMVIDGLVVKLDIPQLKEMIHLLGKLGNNINQIAKQANTTQQVHDYDLYYIHQALDALWDKANSVLQSLALLK